jgi:hypothetical protein
LLILQLTSHAKVDRWFQLRAESGFVDGTGDELAAEPCDLAAAEALMKRHKRKKRRGKLSFRFGRSTF